MLANTIDVDYRTLANWEARQGSWAVAESCLPHVEKVLQYSDELQLIAARNTSIKARLLQLVSEVYSKKSKYTDAKARLDEALKLILKIDTEVDENAIIYADILLSLGRFLTWKTDAGAECIKALDHAYRLMKEIYGENDSVHTMRARGAIAVAHNNFGAPENAVATLKELLDSPALPPEDWQEAGWKHNLADFYFKDNDLATAFSLMVSSIDIYRKHKHPQLYYVLVARGWSCFNKIRNVDKAHELFSEVVTGYKESDPELTHIRPIFLAEAYYGLAKIALQQVDITMCKTYIEKIHELDQKYAIDIGSHINFKDYQSFEDEIEKHESNVSRHRAIGSPS